MGQNSSAGKDKQQIWSREKVSPPLGLPVSFQHLSVPLNWLGMGDDLVSSKEIEGILFLRAVLKGTFRYQLGFLLRVQSYACLLRSKSPCLWWGLFSGKCASDYNLSLRGQLACYLGKELISPPSPLRLAIHIFPFHSPLRIVKNYINI